MDENRRRDKLDDALFIMGSVGILFGLIQFSVGSSTILQFIIPVGLLGWILPFYYGFIRGAIGDSIADRYRGWIFLVLGLSLYATIVAEQELSGLIKDTRLQWVVPLSFTPLLLLLLYRMPKFRGFVLGSNFPRNEVLSRSAWNAALVAGMIAIAGGFLAIVRFLTVWDMIVVGPLAILAAIFLRRSNSDAKRIYWHYIPVEKKGMLHGKKGAEMAYRILRSVAFVAFASAAVPAGLVGYLGYDRTLLLPFTFSLLGLATVLAVPVAILRFLTRSRQELLFDRLGPEESLPDQDI